MDCHLKKKGGEINLYVTPINFSKNLLEVVCIKFPCSYSGKKKWKKLFLLFDTPTACIVFGGGWGDFLGIRAFPRDKPKVTHAHIEPQNPAFSLCVPLILFGTN